jgi:hypothetical protein
VSEIAFTLKPSKICLKLLIVLSILMISVITHLMADIPLSYKMLIGILIMLINVFFSYQHLFLAPYAVIRCHKISEDNQWILHTHHGKEYAAKLEGNSLITSFLIILNFKRVDKKCTSVLIFRDSLPPETFRALCALLHLKKS